MLPKICIFTWRIGHDILPNNVNIGSVIQSHDKRCLRCGDADKTLVHTLKDCPKARMVLSHGGIDDKIINCNVVRGIDWLEHAIYYLDKNA